MTRPSKEALMGSINLLRADARDWVSEAEMGEILNCETTALGDEMRATAQRLGSVAAWLEEMAKEDGA